MKRICKKPFPEIYWMSYKEPSCIVISLPVVIWLKVKEIYNIRLNNIHKIIGVAGDFDASWGINGQQITTLQTNGQVDIIVPIAEKITTEMSIAIENLMACIGYIAHEKPDITTTQNQVMVVTGMVCEWRRCDLHVSTSWPFRQWLGAVGKSLEYEIDQIICNIFHNNSSSHRKNSTVEFDLSQFHIHLPEDDCPCFHSGQPLPPDREEGFTLYTHNIDYPHQQFALLAAVAFLWGKARENLYGSLTTTPPSP